jgi:hypothetical protein
MAIERIQPFILVKILIPYVSKNITATETEIFSGIIVVARITESANLLIERESGKTLHFLEQVMNPTKWKFQANNLQGIY